MKIIASKGSILGGIQHHHRFGEFFVGIKALAHVFNEVHDSPCNSDAAKSSEANQLFTPIDS